MDKVLENRIYLLIREMTLEEKTGMIHGAGLFRTALRNKGNTHRRK